jgi:general secretion pathway protein G
MRIDCGNCGKRGYTLVEMLTVLFIVGMLVAIVLGSARYAMQLTRRSGAKADLHFLADALDRYALVFGTYPDVDSVTNLVAYSRQTLNKSSTYRVGNLLPPGFSGIDPWGSPYRYELQRIGGHEEELPLYQLAWDGPAGKEGTDDDLTYP